MPVISIGNNGLNKNTTSQQVSSPITKDNDAVILDNVLQLDQKVRTILGISQNLANDSSKIRQTDKNLLLTDKVFFVDSFTQISSTTPVIIQGTNYSVITPKEDTIIIDNSPTPIIFENIEFYSPKANTIIQIKNESKVLFKNCIFRKNNNIQGAGNIYIEIDNLCNVSFVGCWFLGTQINGNVIDNNSAVGDVSINGGFNTTNITHINVSIFGEQT